jgi:hypothetical protein
MRVARIHAVLAATVGVFFLPSVADFWPGGDGALHRGAETYVVPVPRWSVRTAAADGRATYLAFDDSVHEMLADGAAARGWRYVEQMGAAHLLEREGCRLYVTTQQRDGVLVELRYEVVPFTL